MRKEGNDQLLSLAQGPDSRTYFYKGYIINGFRFCTKEAEKNLETQNSRVIVKCDEVTGNADYHSVITHIIQLQYLGREHVVMFRCDWFEVPQQNKTQGREYKKMSMGLSVSTSCAFALRMSILY